MTPEQINALVQGDYDDIFAILGMHQTEDGGVEVKALLPGAERVFVIDQASGEVAAEMHLVHPEGLYNTRISDAQPFAYRLVVEYPLTTISIDDPYRFTSLLNDDDVYLFGEGTQERLYHWMGAHAREIDGVQGTMFVVWAPDAKRVSVVGNFNHWDGRRHIMRKHPASGLWDIFIPGLGADEV